MTPILLAALASTAFAAPTVIGLVPAGVDSNIEFFPAEGTEGQILVARLSAGGSAFLVKSVAYELVGASDQCDSGAGHVARVWKSDALTPPETLDVGRVFQIPQTMDAGSRLITLPLARGLRLEAGQSLFVAIEMSREEDVSMCLAGASEKIQDTLRQFVSPEMQGPFQWSSFESIGIESTMAISAVGYPLRSVN